jgi:GNAT superfamily N-acetyltransferase
MNVIDLPQDQEELYCQCLEEWSEEMREAGDLKRTWYQRMKERGLRVKVAVDDQGTIGGMIHYGPIENVPVQGIGLYYIYCIWVHGYKQGRGNHQHKGMGSALIAAAEEDARALGAGGLVAWGLSIPVFIRAAWFRKHGYVETDRNGMMRLLWKRFREDSAAPSWMKSDRKPGLVDGKVTVTSVINGWCPAQNLAHERARRAAAALGPNVVFREIDAFERNVGLEWGTSDALYVDRKQVRVGPPPSYEKIRKVIERRARRLKPVAG